ARLLLTVVPTTGSPTASKRIRKSQKRRRELRQLSEGIYIGDDYILIRTNSTQWRTSDVELSIKRVLQQFFSEKELKFEDITVLQTQSVSRWLMARINFTLVM